MELNAAASMASKLGEVSTTTREETLALEGVSMVQE